MVTNNYEISSPYVRSIPKRKYYPRVEKALSSVQQCPGATYVPLLRTPPDFSHGRQTPPRPFMYLSLSPIFCLLKLGLQKPFADILCSVF